ncbi:hypothetical protein [Paenibacillus polymyxa]|uniref:hypothetical protein n=1 Tax=Paenibacillus polymyxa TaxID=1406 RepID=UPI000496C142|nr:hypothetical protein [Paenibacillus polymyxa]
MEYHELISKLEIPSTADYIIYGIQFLLRTDDERQDMFVHCCNNPGYENIYLTNKWKYNIDTRGYKNKSEFINDYRLNSREALERLCQEEVMDFKLSKFRTDNPERIYDVYSEQGRYTTLLELAYYS